MTNDNRPLTATHDVVIARCTDPGPAALRALYAMRALHALHATTAITATTRRLRMTALRTRYRVTGILAPHSTTVLCHFRTTSQSGTHPVGPSQFAVHWIDRLRHGLGGPANSFTNSKSHSLAQSNAVPEPNPSSRAKNSAAR